MPLLFPERFDPTAWRGQRARAYPDRDDAFQQLVGHALQEIWGTRAHVAPTAGRDGSIDAWVEEATNNSNRGFGLPFPIAVECKHHALEARDPAKNLYRGWGAVQKKLKKQAEAGWPGEFAPWRSARGYLYCVSLQLHNQAVRDHLEREIRQFFCDLPADRKPPVEAVKVLDWADLRTWFDRHPRLADAWLGTELPAVVDHQTFLRSLAGFRRCLLEEELPYVPPEPSDPAHADALLGLLEERAGRGGVLLTGAGGAGKTRAALEVANRAESSGWRVLHVRPGDEALEVEDLAGPVVAAGGHTLVILDYLNEMPRLNPQALRHRLLPEARQRGQEVALLATARPRHRLLENPEWEGLLAEVPVVPSEAHVDAITRQIRGTLAPTAASILGAERVRLLCGCRPILALFIARELERRATEGTLDEASVAELRRGDLITWLRKRLEEHNLTLPPCRRLLPPDPEPGLLAAAAALAAAPQERMALVNVASTVLGERGRYGDALVGNLVVLGWLEKQGSQLVAAHDVVADEVLEQTLRIEPGGGVRSDALFAILDSAATSPRCLGRFAVALRRLGSPSAGPGGFIPALCQVAGEWLEGAAERLGPTFSRSEPDEAGYALGAILSGPPWDEVAAQLWDQLPGRWLDRWGLEPEARHLLYIGLRCAGEISQHLAGHALAWLRSHPRLQAASFVIGPLLRLRTLTVEEGREATGRALGWLEEHRLVPEANFVLGPLLERPDLGDRASEAIRGALGWLRAHPLLPEAQYVLHPLLERPDLDEYASEAIHGALGWLRAHPLPPEAQYVLHPLLERPDLDKHASEAIQGALRWLEEHRLLPEADFVLGPLLKRPDLGEHATDAIQGTLDWLNEHIRSVNAEFVLKNLFQRAELSSFEVAVVMRLALRRAETVLDSAEATFILRTVLQRRDLPEGLQDEAIDLGFSWARRFPESDDLDFVLKRILRRPDLEDDLWVEAATLALSWLRRTPFKKDRDHLLLSCFTRPHLLQPDEREAVIRDALSWLSDPGVPEPPDRRLHHALYRAAEGTSLEAEVASCTGRHASVSEKLLTLAEDPGSRVPMSLLDRGFEETRELLSISTGNPGAAAYFLTSLLPLTARLPDPVLLEEASDLARRLLAHPELQEPQRRGFIHACRRLLEQGAWPDEDQAARTLGALGLATDDLMADIAETLRAWAEEVDFTPRAEDLLGALAEAEQRLDDGRPASAAFVVAPLLPLTARLERLDLHDRTRDLARRLLSHVDLNTSQRLGFGLACHRLLELGAWPDAELGARTVAACGVDLTAVEFAQTDKVLQQYAENPTSKPEPALLESGLEQARDLLEAGHPASACFFITSLLPLTARCGTEAQAAEAQRLATLIVRHPGFDARHHRGFAKHSLRLLDSGAWSDRDYGSKILATLNVVRFVPRRPAK